MEFHRREGYSYKFKKKLKLFIAVGSVGLLLALIAAYTAYQIDETRYLMSVTCFHFYFFMMVIGLIALIYLIAPYICSNGFCCIVSFLADKTLGIYILHPLIFSLLSKCQFIDCLEVGYVKNGILCILTFTVSFFTVTLAHILLPENLKKYI